MQTGIQFTDTEITSWGGVSIWKKMTDRSGFVSYPAGLPLPEQGSPRCYSPIQLFLHFMSGVWCGAERHTYLNIMRLDNTLQRLYGWKRIPEHKAFERYFRKFDMQSIQQVFGGLYKWFFNRLQFNN